jgi:hypothetical protein
MIEASRSRPPAVRERRNAVRSLAVFLPATVFGGSASAAGVDSRLYTCAELQSLIAARGFVFISAATFGDFAVAGPSVCASASGEIVQLRSVETRDRPECPINYCVSRSGGGAGGGM